MGLRVYNRRGSSLGDTITALSWFFLFVLWASRGLHINFFLAILVVAVGYAFLIGIMFAISSIDDWLKKRKQRALERRPCVHGVKPFAEVPCDICSAERVQREEESRRRVAEHELKRQLKLAAQELRSNEVRRLSRAWLSSSETYFSMGPRQFENSVAQIFENLGYVVEQTPYSNDGGKDAILKRDGKIYLVECKRYNATNCIGRPDIQKFVAAMVDERASGGFYVNTGRYSPAAKKYAEGHNVVIYDRHTFPSLVLQAYPVAEDSKTAATMCIECGEVVSILVSDQIVTARCALGHEVSNTITLGNLRVFKPNSTTPYCEACGSPMRVVNGYRGRFWGCSEYPRCKYTRKFSKRVGQQIPSQ